MKTTIKHNRFILRPLRMKDAKSITEHANDRLVSRGLGRMPYPYKLKDARQFILGVERDYKRKKPEHFRLAIEIDGKAVGVIALHVWQKTENYKAEIGYWIGRKYWGQGLMTEIIKTAVSHGFKKLGFQRIYANVFPFNRASMKVLKKNKFKFEGIQRKNVKKGKKYFDHYLFARVK